MSIVVLPLGEVSIVVSSTHTGFQLISNFIERIGVSSSSGLVLSSVIGISPRSTCRQTFLVVRVAVFQLLTWYMVLWGRCLWLLIVMTSSGVDVVYCGDAVGWVMWLLDLFVIVRVWFVGLWVSSMRLVRVLGCLFG